MKINNFEKSNTPEFNMAIRYLERLDKRCDENDTASIEGNTVRWHRCLASIYRNVYFKLPPESREIIETKLSETRKLINSDSNPKFAELYKFQIRTVELKLNDINILLYEMMAKNDLIFPRKLEINWNDNIRESFR